MDNDTIVGFCDPAFRDELSDLVRDGARRIIRQAVGAELKAFLEAHGATNSPHTRREKVHFGMEFPSRSNQSRDIKSTRFTPCNA